MADFDNSPLLQKIRIAQRNAGELAVIQDLHEKGLCDNKCVFCRAVKESEYARMALKELRERLPKAQEGTTGTAKCPCGHPSCGKYYLTNIGTFYQGCGFDKETAELLAWLWNNRQDIKTLLETHYANQS